MRVVVCVDPMCGLTSNDAGTAIARAFAARGAECAVVPMGQAGRGASESIADLLGAEPRLWQTEPGSGLLVALAVAERAAVADVQALDDSPIPDFAGSSRPAGEVVGSILRAHPGLERLYLDVHAARWHDGGAGFLSSLGALADAPLTEGVGALAGVTRVDIAPATTRIVLLASPEEATTPLTGLRGMTVRRGRQEGIGLPDQLATDRALERFASACRPVPPGVSGTSDGGGARGGLGFAVQALGGCVRTGDAACAELADLPGTLAVADLVIVGCDELDFGHWDETSVLPLAAAVDARVPVVALARRNHVSNRELRTRAIEAAHSLVAEDRDVPSSDRITRLLSGLAATWLPDR